MHTQPSHSLQTQIQWGVLFLTSVSRKFSPEERKQYLQEVWEWARERADLVWLQMIRD